LKVLKKDHDVKIRFPMDVELKEQCTIIANKHENLQRIYCMMDGLKLRFKFCAKLTTQEKYYNR
jgi:hypothetical protein